MYLRPGPHRTLDQPMLGGLRNGDGEKLIPVHQTVKRPLEAIAFPEHDTRRGRAFRIDAHIVRASGTGGKTGCPSINNAFKILAQKASLSRSVAG